MGHSTLKLELYDKKEAGAYAGLRATMSNKCHSTLKLELFEILKLCRSEKEEKNPPRRARCLTGVSGVQTRQGTQGHSHAHGKSMSETAEAVAADVGTRRNVTIEINNLTNNYCLLNPRVFLDSGETYNPPQPTVRPLKAEVCSFSKNKAKATGSVGVMTYDLFERSRNDYVETLAIMFSIPWDYNLYKNWFAVGIYPKGRACDEALYKEMYYDKKQKDFVREQANGSGIDYVGNHLDVRATMSPMGKAIMKVEVWDKLLVPGFNYAQQAQ
ncbi:hypothetical protein ACEWY4_003038 [Coilia grayii]|uniref:Actinoporin n=1 Tax=Coilia grayii TaxID=363190 RepID=A0ABD1KQ72_9TELE